MNHKPNQELESTMDVDTIIIQVACKRLRKLLSQVVIRC